MGLFGRLSAPLGASGEICSTGSSSPALSGKVWSGSFASWGEVGVRIGSLACKKVVTASLVSLLSLMHAAGMSFGHSFWLL